MGRREWETDTTSFLFSLTLPTCFPIIQLHFGVQINFLNPKCPYSNVGAWLSLVERSVRDREVGGSNPLAPTNHINNLRLPALAAVSLVWEICDQSSENAHFSEAGRHECIASSSSDPCGPSESLLLEPHIQLALDAYRT